jgi:glycosyltransferase involved in cell wall biosynthesis
VTAAVSVVVPAYNQVHYVRPAVESALAQTFAPLEVIVVNDGSTDGTLDALEPLLGSIVLIDQPNAGVAEARNVGARAARGDLVAFLDADDVWLPYKLERQAALFAADPRVGLVHCGIVVTDGELHTIGERVVGVEGDDVAERMLLGQEGALHAGGSTMTLSQAALEAVGPFDARLPPSEDWDMTYRVARRFRIGFVGEPLVLYRLHHANAHRDIARVERGMTIAFAKAFEEPDAGIQRLRRRAYGFLHVMLAGSAWEVGDRRRFIRNAVAAIRVRPATARAFLGFPVRRARRALGRS